MSMKKERISDAILRNVHRTKDRCINCLLRGQGIPGVNSLRIKVEPLSIQTYYK